MRFLVGTRRCGKTTKLVQKMLEHDGDCIFLCNNHRQIDNIVRDIIKNKTNLTEEYSKDGRYIKTSNGRKYFMTYENFLYKKENNPNFYFGSKLPKFIDNFEFYLKQEFGNIKYASATGPNFSGFLDISEKFPKQLEDIKNHITENQFETEFKKEWSDET